MVHTGYLFGQQKNAPSAANEQYHISGPTFGIGGALRIHLWRHLRVGAEGFVSTVSSRLTPNSHLVHGSYIRSGWGGVLADACWRTPKLWTYVGGTVGGGVMRSFYLMEGDQSDWQAEEHALFHREGFVMLDPYVGIDWCMTDKVHLTFRLDWLLPLHHQQLLQPTGPRLYLGFMFCH